MNIRIRETGEVLSLSEWAARLASNGVSIPSMGLNAEAIDFHGADPVFEGPQPTGEAWQVARRDGVVQINDKWFTSYLLEPVFETQEEEDDYVEMWMNTRRTDIMPALADRRWQAEVGGTTVGGIPVSTDRESQSKLTAAFVQADKNPAFNIPNWKVAPGTFVTLDATTIIALGNAVTAHVQACFDREAELCNEILNAVDDVDLAAIDINSGWPS